VVNQEAWFQAQNTEAKCQALADALGIDVINFYHWDSGCLEYDMFFEELLCSTDSECPSNHLTEIQGSSDPCDSDYSSRSICPCE
jgi:hypothetical protein